MKRCKICGSFVNDNARLCTFCGSDALQPVRPAPPVPPDDRDRTKQTDTGKEKTKRTAIIAGASGAAVVVIAAVVLVAVLLGGKGKDTVIVYRDSPAKSEDAAETNAAPVIDQAVLQTLPARTTEPTTEPTTVPPTTQPPTTLPPATLPPVTEAPATEPPAQYGGISPTHRVSSDTPSHAGIVVRAASTYQSEKLAVLSEGTPVELLDGREVNGYVYVAFLSGGARTLGWVMPDYLTPLG